jgi:hypothetical protein
MGTVTIVVTALSNYLTMPDNPDSICGILQNLINFMAKKNSNNKENKSEPGENGLTIDHEKIREWTEERGGVPAMVADTMNGGGGILRIDFGQKDEELEAISWEEFFHIFEDKNLAFLYQEKTAHGEMSRFFKFVDRDTSEDLEEEVDEDDMDDEEVLSDEYI